MINFKIWFMVTSICTGITTDVIAENNAQHKISAAHTRFKRYHYPKPQGWTYTPFNPPQDFSNNYPSNQGNPFNNGYNYDYPGINVPQIGLPWMLPNQQRPPYYEFSMYDSKFIEKPATPNQYFNEPTSSVLPNENYPGFIDIQNVPPQQDVPNPNIGQSELPLSTGVEDRLAVSTVGDDQGAFILPNILEFGLDTQNFTIGPTGLFIAKSQGIPSTPFAADIDVPCNETYNKPPIPNFEAPGRRISDVKCYEYVWELRIRANIENRSIECNKTRSKRSYVSWNEHYWQPQADYQQTDNFQTTWSQEMDLPQMGFNLTAQPDTSNITFINTEALAISFEDAGVEEFPHMAAIGWRGFGDEYVFKCGGSLISHNFVLTAAHCTASGPDTAISDIVPRIVRIGDINIGYQADGRTFTQKRRRRQIRDPGRLDINIIDIIVHEQYDPNMRYNDIALFKLEYDLEFNKHLQPACLWTDPNTSMRIRKAVASGWGVVDVATSRTSAALQAGELDIIDTQTCNRLLLPSLGTKLSEIVDHQICAGKLSGGMDVCQGDSGGPLQVKIQLPIKNQGSMHTILGIISAGVGCARPDTPGVYTRITSFIDWIERNVWP